MKKLIQSLKEDIKLLYCYITDWNYYRHYSLSCKNNTQDRRLARIMLVMHALEKGLSFTASQKKQTFGQDKAASLTRQVSSCIKQYGMNDVCIVAINVLSEYLKDQRSTRDVKVRAEINELLAHNKDIIESGIAGTKIVEEPPVFDTGLIESFYATRFSVRNFSNAPVTEQEIENARRIASYTPTACNRQTSRIHIIRNTSVIHQLMDNQLGGQNWCDNANILFIITANQSYFGGNYERYQALIDGGLYAMNFVMGLHLGHIASCFKMYVRDPALEREFKKIAQIPYNELPVVCILAGHYKKDGLVCSPKSHRFNFDK